MVDGKDVFLNLVPSTYKKEKSAETQINKEELI